MKKERKVLLDEEGNLLHDPQPATGTLFDFRAFIEEEEDSEAAAEAVECYQELLAQVESELLRGERAASPPQERITATKHLELLDHARTRFTGANDRP